MEFFGFMINFNTAESFRKLNHTLDRILEGGVQANFFLLIIFGCVAIGSFEPFTSPMLLIPMSTEPHSPTSDGE